MSHADDLAPWDRGIGAPRRGGDFAGCLADDFQRADDGILVKAAGAECGLVDTLEEIERVLGGNSMCRSSAWSADGLSAIDRFGTRQDLAAEDVVAAGLHGVPVHEIDGAAQEVLQVVGQAEIALQCSEAGCRLELDEEIRVAAIEVEIGAACRRAEDRQPAHRVAAAEPGDRFTMLLDEGVHGAP